MLTNPALLNTLSTALNRSLELKSHRTSSMLLSIIAILPSEIIEDTIDILADDDRQSDPFILRNVKACSLTCRTFLPRSRQHIFRSVKIHEAERYIPRFPAEDPPSPLASSLRKLLTSSPHITEYIRELYYVFPEIGGSLSGVPPVLQELIKLEKFALYSDNGGTLEWWGLNPQSRSIFLRLIHLPSITSLRLRSVHNFPPSVLFPCVNLQSVYLDEISIDECDVASPVKGSISKTINLQELELLRMGRSINESMSTIWKKTTQNGRPIFDLESLKTLTVAIKYQGHVQLTSKLIKHAQNIRNIHLFIEPPHNFGHDDLVTIDQIVPLLSPSLKTLRSLTLDINIDTLKSAPLGGAPRALKGIGSKANMIECLQIRLNVNRGGEYIYKGDLADESEWASLEEVLLAPGYWPCLKRVDLGIFAEGSLRGERWGKELSEFVNMRLYGLSSELEVEFSIFVADEPKEPRTSIERAMV